jgi:RNA polymerase sigma-70 factor, ECF subfamily
MTDGSCRRVPGLPGGDSFEAVVLPHLDAACRLARYLLRNEHDAEDAVQEASLRAFRYFRTFSGGNGRAWFLRIVRNTCHGWRGHSMRAATESFDEVQHSQCRPASDPETLALRVDDVLSIEQAMTHVPDRGRALLMLRAFDGLSYRELAEAMDMPVGTVMSTLWRARRVLRDRMESQTRWSTPAKTGCERGAVPVRTVRRPRAVRGNNMVEASAIPAAQP